MRSEVAITFLIAGWLPMMIGIMRRRDVASTPAVVPRTDRVLLILTWIFCIGLTIVAALDVRTTRSSWRVTTGVAMFLLSMVTWTWGRAAHGGHFAQITGVPPTLITSGPYRFVRHPLYLATVLGTAGHALAAGTIRAWALWLAIVLVLAIRAHREETVLHGAMGRTWETYARRSLGIRGARRVERSPKQPRS